MNESLLEDHNSVAVNVTQLGKCSWSKRENLSLDPQSPHGSCILEHNLNTNPSEG